MISTNQLHQLEMGRKQNDAVGCVGEIGSNKEKKGSPMISVIIPF